MIKNITFTINGREKSIDVDTRESLLELIRDTLGLKGTKAGCHVGECGACTVLIDGSPIDSCIYLAVWADGKEIRTVEGVGTPLSLSPMQKAFVDKGAVQCGYCTPGFIMTATHIQEQKPNIGREEIKREISGNLCRCTGYKKIIEAVEDALKETQSGKQQL